MYKKIVLFILGNTLCLIVSFYGIYIYFEYQNNLMSTKIDAESTLKSLAAFGTNVIGEDIKDIELFFSFREFPEFSNVESTIIGEDRYLVYESNIYQDHIFFVVFKFSQSKITGFFVIAMDTTMSKKFILPTTIELDKDMINVLIPLLNKSSSKIY